MSSHGGAVAEASPYLGSIFPVVMLQSTRPGPATHRPAAPICLVRHARTDGSDGATSVSMSPGLRARPLEGPRAARGRLRVEVSCAPADHDHLARLLMLGPGLRPGEVELIEDVRAR